MVEMFLWLALLGLCTYWLYKLISYLSALKKELVDACRRNLDYVNQINEKQRSIILLQTSLCITTLLLAAQRKDYDQFDFIYNRLYFWGVKKEILDDAEQLQLFLNGCMDEKVSVNTGTAPYKYEFSMEDSQ